MTAGGQHRRRSWRSLGVKLVLSHIVVIAIATAISTVAMLSLAERYFVNADRESLSLQAQLLAQSCDTVCLSTRAVSVAIPAEALPPASNVTQTNSRGGSLGNLGQRGEAVTTALTSTVRIVRSEDDVRDSSVLLAALQGQRQTRLIGDTLTAAAPVVLAGKVIGAVEVSAPIDDARQVVKALRRRSLEAAALAVLVAVVVAALRARQIAKPLRELGGAAAALSAGDYKHRLPSLRSGDEVGDLATSFAAMRTQVQDQLASRASFVADASHELRTPLASIKGYIELLQDGAAEKPDVRTRFLNSMATETDRMVRLTDDLLLLSRADSSMLEVRQMVVSWNSFIEESVGQLQPAIRGRHIDVLVEHASADGTVAIDPDRMHQVVANLLDNAIRHARSTVEVWTTISPDSVSFHVGDDGSGIDKNQRQRVFERFARLDTARARDGSGNAGLGLAIVKAIVTAHRGTIEVVPSATGGALFRVTLPRSSVRQV